MSLKPCSYGAAPHRDQRALGSATPPSFPMWRLQGTSKGQNTDTKPAGWRGKPHCQPPPLPQARPIPEVFTLGSLSPCSERDGSRVQLSPCNRQGLSWSPPADPVLSSLHSAFTPSPSTAGVGLTRGCSKEVGPHPPNSAWLHPLIPAAVVSWLHLPNTHTSEWSHTTEVPGSPTTQSPCPAAPPSLGCQKAAAPPT